MDLPRLHRPRSPWKCLQRIGQWLAQALAPPGAGAPLVIPYTLHLYGIVQATLAMSLCLSLAFASLATEPGRAFSIVAGNAWLHLLLDIIEINGPTASTSCHPSTGG